MSVALFILAAAAVSSAPRSNVPEDVAVQAVHDFGACVADRTPQGARDLLAMDYNSPAYDEKLRRYLKGHDYCIPFDGSMSSSRLLFAGAMAEALLKSDFKQAELPLRLAYDPQRALLEAHSLGEAMALCTVLEAPRATAQIFETEPATPDEIAAMKPLGSVLPKCLRKDMKLTLNKPALRSLLALAAWRIATAPHEAAQ